MQQLHIWFLYLALSCLLSVGCHSVLPLLRPTPSLPTAARATATPLPAPLYFLSHQGQIMRLETDGVTVHQVTNAATSITAFDVDPTGTYLVYVSNNELIRTTAWGEEPLLLFSGGPLGEPNTTAPYINNIYRIAFAPDGRRLAFERNGIQLLNDITAPDPAATLETLLPNGPDPTLPPGAALYFLQSRIYPSYWSPDGQRLFVNGGLMNTDAYEYLILDLKTRELTRPDWLPSEQPGSGQAQPPFCIIGIGLSAAYWDRSSQLLYRASDFLEMFGPPSLASIQVTDGTVTPLFYADPACNTSGAVEATAPRLRFHSVYQTTLGALWGFVNATDDSASPHLAPMMMVHLDPATKQVTPLRNDRYLLDQEILWDTADRGAVVIVRERAGELLNLTYGRLFWLSSDGAPALDLALDGWHLRWGAEHD